MRFFKRLKILIPIIIIIFGNNLWANLPSAIHDLGDNYWSENTDGDTANGFNVTLSAEATRKTSQNSFFFKSTTKDSGGRLYAIVTFTADNTDLATFDLDLFYVENFGRSYDIDIEASNGEKHHYDSEGRGRTTIDIDETTFNDITWFSVKITEVSGNNIDSMDLRSFVLKDMKAPVVNTPPTATSVGFSGTIQDGEILTGTYTYADADSDTESDSTFKWYRSDNASGSNKIAISGATSKTFKLTSSEVGKYISFEVTPKNANGIGSATGSSINSTAVASSNQAPTNTLPTAPTVAEDDTNVAFGSSIHIADTDEDNQEVTLTATNGTLSMGSGSSTIFSIGDGRDDIVIAFSEGNLASLNDILDTLTFTPTANFNGTATLKMQTDDGNGGTDDDTLNITVSSVNDAPTDIELSRISVNQSDGANTGVGGLSGTDVDTDLISLTYTLIEGVGYTDNNKFTIYKENYTTLKVTDPSTMSGDYSVRINVNDGDSDFAKAFTITVVDDVAPLVTALSPADDATGVSATTNLVVTFNEDVEKKATSGNIIIKRSSDNTVFERIMVDSNLVSISGAVVTINPNTTLDLNTNYYVQIEFDSIGDSAGNDFRGITDTTSWSFKTIADSTPPTISSLTIPNSSMKIGSEVTVTITVPSDTDNYTTGSGAISGTVGGFALGSFVKTDDTTYTAKFTVINGGTDVSSGSDIPVSIKLTDSVGNQMATAFTTSISQNSDLIDANTPALSSVSIASNNANTTKAKVGDEITISFTASETLNANPIVTIAGKSATVVKVNGNIYTAKYIMAIGDTEEIIPFTINFSDSIGNVGIEVTGSTISSSIIFDKTAPTGYSMNFITDPINSTNKTAVETSWAGMEFGTSYTFTIDDTDDSTDPMISTGIVNFGDNSGEFDLSGLSDGTLTLTITLTDPTGNVGTSVSNTVLKDIILPVITQTTAVATPTTDNTPDYIFNTIENGTLIVGGSCDTSTPTTLSAGDVTVTLTQIDNSIALADGTYTNCTITVTDINGNPSNTLTIPSFTIDTTAPTATFDPVNSNANHPINNNITITFSELIKNSGNTEITDANVANLITLKKTDANGEAVVFTATIDSAKKVVTIDPTDSLIEAQLYYLSYADVTDGLGNEKASESITFTAKPDTTAPTVVSFLPEDGNTSTPIDTNLTIVFSENVQVGTGSISIDFTVNGMVETFEEIDITGDRVTIYNNIVTIEPLNNLDFNTKYHIHIDGTAIKDMASTPNNYAGISSNVDWDFTTVKDITPDEFSFASLTNKNRSTQFESNEVNITGINDGIDISIVGGEYKINSESWTSDDGSINNDDNVTLRLTSSGSYSSTKTASLTIGDVSKSFSVRTKSAPNSKPTIDEVSDIINIDDNQTINPFSTVELGDANKNNLSIELVLDSDKTGELSSYKIESDDIASVEELLKAIEFTPYENIALVGENNITTITLKVSDGKDTVTKTLDINSTSINIEPTIDTTIEDKKFEIDTTQSFNINISDSDLDELNLTIESDNEAVEIITNYNNPIVDSDYKVNGFNFTIQSKEDVNATITIILNDGYKTITKEFDVEIFKIVEIVEEIPTEEPIVEVKPVEVIIEEKPVEPIVEVIDENLTKENNITVVADNNKTEESDKTPIEPVVEDAEEEELKVEPELEVILKDNGLFIPFLENTQDKNSSITPDENIDFNIDEDENSVTAQFIIGNSTIIFALNKKDASLQIIIKDDATGEDKIFDFKLKGTQTDIDEDGNINVDVETDENNYIKTTIRNDGGSEHLVEYNGLRTKATSNINAKVDIDENANVSTIAEIKRGEFIYKAVVTTDKKGRTQTKFIKINQETGEEINLSNTLKEGELFEAGNIVEIFIVDELMYIKTTAPLNNDLIIE